MKESNRLLMTGTIALMRSQLDALEHALAEEKDLFAGKKSDKPDSSDKSPDAIAHWLAGRDIMTLSETIDAICAEFKLTPAALARMMGVNQGRITEARNGHAGKKFLARFAEVFGSHAAAPALSDAERLKSLLETWAERDLATLLGVSPKLIHAVAYRSYNSQTLHKALEAFHG